MDTKTDLIKKLTKEIANDTCNQNLVLYDNIIDQVLIDKNQYISKLTHKLNTLRIPKYLTRNSEDNSLMRKHFNIKLAKIRKILQNKDTDQYTLHIIDNYLSALLNINEKCDIIDIYTNNSMIIHLIALIVDHTLLYRDDEEVTVRKDNKIKIFEHDSLNMSQHFIFSRCLFSVRVVNYLLNGQISKNIQNAKENMYIDTLDLKDVINNIDKYEDDYYISLSAHSHWIESQNMSHNYSKFNHILAIIKKKINSVNKYFIVQSYIYKHCPKKVVYELNDILNMIDDVQRILCARSPADAIWTADDNATWMKYFLADEKAYIGKTMYHDTLIKIPLYKGISKSYVFLYNAKPINRSKCYENILLLTNNARNIIYNLFDDMCLNLINCFIHDNNSGYSRQNVINAIYSDSFVKVVNNLFVGSDFIKSLKNVNNESDFDTDNVNWTVYYSQVKSTITGKYLQFFNVGSCTQFIYLLYVITHFFHLENQLSNKKSDCLVGGNKYYKKYIESKKKYISMK
jgi:hypothetical protein